MKEVVRSVENEEGGSGENEGKGAYRMRVEIKEEKREK